MNLLRLGSAFALCAAFGAATAAQTPVKPPPWWRVNDDVTVSLAWDFDNPVTFLQPSLAVVPTWYNAAVTGFVVPPTVVWQPAFAGHTGVLSLVGTGAPTSANVELKVDNDPHIDWIKIFWFQFDAFEGTSGDIKRLIEKNLAQYGRASVEQEIEPLGGGWDRVTIKALLIPQPDDEKMVWELIENSFGTVAIDNLFVGSKCVKPGDEKGGALGQVDGLSFDLFAATGTQCNAAAVTEGPAPTFARTYWVSTRSAAPGVFHQVVRLNQAGVLVGATPIPDTVAQAPLGAMDLAVEVVPGTGQQFVYAVVDRRPSGGNVALLALNSAGTLLPAQSVTLATMPAPIGQKLGLAFDPSGELGAGTFWVTDELGTAHEFNRAGVLLGSHPIPAGTVGFGYDHTYGYFYGFRGTPLPSPTGPVQVNGYEWSGFDFAPTGVEFCGDRTIPNPGGTPGGTASGLEVYRRGATGEFRMVAVVQLQSPPTTVLYEMKGPFRYGWSLMGRCGMRGGPAFEGSPTFEITLSGVPDAVVAGLYAGLSNDVWSAVPLPLPLSGLGIDESFVSVSLDVPLGAFVPSAPGEFSHAVLLPFAGGLANTPLFFQWIVLDPSVPGGMAATQAGKTLAY
jgi:hypothetical protein